MPRALSVTEKIHSLSFALAATSIRGGTFAAVVNCVSDQVLKYLRQKRTFNAYGCLKGNVGCHECGRSVDLGTQIVDRICTGLRRMNGHRRMDLLRPTAASWRRFSTNVVACFPACGYVPLALCRRRHRSAARAIPKKAVIVRRGAFRSWLAV
jgi:hypothetical protein